MKELDDVQKEKFMQLIASNAPYGDFQTYLNLGQRDVEFYRNKYANEQIKPKKPYQKSIQEQRAAQLEAKMRQEKLHKVSQNMSPPNVVAVIPNHKSQKDRVKTFNQINAAKEILDKDLPSVPEDQFKMDARLGVRLLMQKYDFEKKIVVALLKKFKINIDLLPR